MFSHRSFQILVPKQTKTAATGRCTRFAFYFSTFSNSCAPGFPIACGSPASAKSSYETPSRGWQQRISRLPQQCQRSIAELCQTPGARDLLDQSRDESGQTWPVDILSPSEFSS